MARNRFEQYQSNPYQQQFVPTPMNANLLMGALGQKQKSFDSALNSASTFTPEVSYYHGDRETADGLINQYSQKSNDIVESLYADGDGNNAARTIAQMNQGYLKDKQTGEISALAQRKSQYDASITSINKIKNTEDRQRALGYFQNTAHTEFGLDSPLNQPIILDNPGISEKALAIGKAIKADGWMIGDGRIITSDDNGMYNVTVNGTTTQIDPNDAYGIIENYLLGDEQVRSYMGSRQQIGDPVDLRNTIASVASAVGFTKTTGSYGFHKDVKKGIDYANGNFPLSIQPGNPTLLAEGMTMDDLNTSIASSDGGSKGILTAYKLEAQKAFDESEKGKAFKASASDHTDFQNEYIESLTDNYDIQSASDYGVLQSLKEVFSKMKASEFSNVMNNEDKLKEIVKQHSPDGYEEIITTSLMDIKGNTPSGKKEETYIELRDEFMSDGYSMTPTEIIPGKKGTAAAEYNTKLHNALSEQNFEVLQGFNISTNKPNSYDLGAGDKSKTNQKVLNEMKAGTVESVRINKYGNALIPPTFTVEVTTDEGLQEITLMPKYNTQTEGYSIPSSVSDLIKELDATGSLLGNAVENSLLEDRENNYFGLYDNNDPHQNVKDKLLPSSNTQIEAIKPYIGKDTNGHEGNYIRIEEKGNVPYDITFNRIFESMENLGIDLETNEDAMGLKQFIKENGTNPNTPFNFDLFPDPQAKEKFLKTFIIPAFNIKED